MVISPPIVKGVVISFFLFFVILLFHFSIKAQATPNNALSFDGNDEVRRAQITGLNSAFTTEAWIRPSVANHTGILMVTTDDSTGWSLELKNGKIEAWINNTAGQWVMVTHPTTLVANTWYHVAMTYQTGSARVFVNGAPGTAVSVGTLSQGPWFRLGALSGYPSFQGQLDEIRLSNVVRYSGAFTVPALAFSSDTNTLALYHLNEGTGQTVGDSSVNANSMNLGTTTAVEASDPTWITSTAPTGGALVTPTPTPSPTPTSTPTPTPTPAGQFVTENVILGLNEPTTLSFTPDGRKLIAQRNGTILVTPTGSNQLNSTPFLQLTNTNMDQGERGLVGLTLDPDFATNGHYYVFYTANSPLRDRVSRFTASGNTTSLSTEVVVWQAPQEAPFWHHGGNIAFGPDGFLYIAVGDGFDTTSGSAHVSQRLTSHQGKILRINKDGTIPTLNPFYDGAGTNYDAIWAYGLRNPFRFSFDGARLYIADVGGNDQANSDEEINIGVEGANYGWPLCEGTCTLPGVTGPFYTYPHANRDASITGGFVYRGGNFPAQYQGSYFYGDYVQNWIQRLTMDANGDLISALPFLPTNGSADGPYGEIVDLKQGPDGAIYYVDIGTTWEGTSNPGTVRRVKFVGGNQPPVITTASANPQSGAGPTLQVQFIGEATDNDSPNLSYLWTFGNGQTSNQQSPLYTYPQPGTYTARLTVSDETNETLSNPIPITIGAPPTATITSPVNGATFRAGDVITFSGTATDPDETIPPSNYSWRVVFHHLSHIHPEMGPVSGTSGTFTIPSSGHEIDNTTGYEFILTVVDSQGLEDSKSVQISPETRNTTYTTSPAGLALSLNQETNLTAPFIRNRVNGFQDTASAPATQTLNGQTYQFVSWSDGGAATHTVTTQPTDRTLTATYQLVSANTYSLSFDGGDEVRRGQITGITGNQTIEAWVKPTTSNQTSLVMLSTDDSVGWSIELKNGKIEFWSATSGGWKMATHSTALAVNAWNHVAVTVNGTNVRVFLNGNPGTQVAFGTLTPGPWFRLGGLTGYGFFRGELDEVRVSNTVRYTTTFTPAITFTQDSSTRALYHMNEGTGQTVTDTSGNTNTMTLGTGAAVETSDPTWVIH